MAALAPNCQSSHSTDFQSLPGSRLPDRLGILRGEQRSVSQYKEVMAQILRARAIGQPSDCNAPFQPRWKAARSTSPLHPRCGRKAAAAEGPDGFDPERCAGHSLRSAAGGLLCLPAPGDRALGHGVRGGPDPRNRRRGGARRRVRAGSGYEAFPVGLSGARRAATDGARTHSAIFREVGISRTCPVCMLMHMRTTLNIDGVVLRRAAELTGVTEKKDQTGAAGSGGVDFPRKRQPLGFRL